jgi:cytochrome c
MSQVHRAALVCLLLTGPVAAQTAPATLAQQNGCLVCHGMLHKQVGPGFAQIAARYQNDPAAAPQLAAKILNGGMGNWGRVSMSRFPHLSEAERLALARWVLAQPPVP